MQLHWLEDTHRLSNAERPPLFTNGRSAFDALDAVYTNGKISFTADARSYGFVGVASRHGVLPAAIVSDGCCILVVVQIVGSFHVLEHDLFTRSSIVGEQFETDSRRDLYYETLNEGYDSKFCDTDANLVRPLHRNCFVCIDSPCCLPCLIQCGEGGESGAFELNSATVRWFDSVLKGVRKAETGISRAFEEKSASFRFVYQRFEEETGFEDIDDLVDYEEDDDDAADRIDHIASIDAIFHIARSSDLTEQQLRCSTPSSNDTDSTLATTIAAVPTRNLVPRAMPNSMSLRPENTGRMRICGDTREDCTFLEKIVQIASERNWERRILASYVKAEAPKSTLDQISLALNLFTPKIVILHRCGNTNKVNLFRYGADPLSIDFEEAHRLVHKHSIVFGFDELNNDVFRSKSNGRNIEFRVSDDIMNEIELECSKTEGSLHNRPLKKLRKALQETY